MKLKETPEELWDALLADFMQIFRASRLPQSFEHTQGTFNWTKKLKPDFDLAMEIAAIGHDLDRCSDEWMVERRNYPDEKSFRIAHAQKSAELVSTFLHEYGFDQELINRVHHLITNHEYGVDEDTLILMKADCFSFFEYNLPIYYMQKGEDRTRDKIHIMLEKLSSQDEEIIRSMISSYNRALPDYSELTDQDWDSLDRIISECIN